MNIYIYVYHFIILLPQVQHSPCFRMPTNSTGAYLADPRSSTGWSCHSWRLGGSKAHLHADRHGAASAGKSGCRSTPWFAADGTSCCPYTCAARCTGGLPTTTCGLITTCATGATAGPCCTCCGARAGAGGHSAPRTGAGPGGQRSTGGVAEKITQRGLWPMWVHPLEPPEKSAGLRFLCD